jgi:hypothetical protein
MVDGHKKKLKHSNIFLNGYRVEDDFWTCYSLQTTDVGADSRRAVLGCVWMPAYGWARPPRCSHRLFGFLDHPPSQAPLVQKAPLGQALQKRGRWAFPSGQARAVQRASRARRKLWPAGARAISLGLPLFFPPFTSSISPSPPPSFSVAHHSLSSNNKCSSPLLCSLFFLSLFIDSSRPNPQRPSLYFVVLVTLGSWGTDRFLLISSHTWCNTPDLSSLVCSSAFDWGAITRSMWYKQSSFLQSPLF